jgi:ATP-dependent helicase HepA
MALSPFAFVRVRGGANGVGKLLEIGEETARLEYFASPAGPDLRLVDVPSADVQEIELSPQTRVYWYDKEISVWRVGRVAAEVIDARALQKSEDHYPVRFPNGKDVYLARSQLYVRWSHPIDDPTAYLAAQITETPFFFEGRRQIVAHLAAQRAAFGGQTGLASSAIELLPHQVAITRRVLADPVERYLLADEVGLGKTIEAGVLIRQHVIDFPQEAQVLVVAPNHLLGQWRSELAAKFFLSQDRRVAVVSEEEASELTDIPRLTMLVVDEAQRPSIRAFDVDEGQRRLYRTLKTLAEQTPRLILLSGTPVLHQEDGFLAMLHLLDPDGYRLEDRELFRRRVRDRQLVADAILDLADDAAALFAEEALDRLALTFSDDQRLMELVCSAREHTSSDEADAARILAFQAVRTHLSELYRLHRRLLRTRRDDPRVIDLLPRRSGALVITCDDPARQEAFAFVEQWRNELILSRSALQDHQGQDQQGPLFTLWVESALSHPAVLLRCIEARLALIQSENAKLLSSTERDLLALPSAFDGEFRLLSEARALIMAAGSTEIRAETIANWLTSHPDIAKVVLFVDHPDIADMVAAHLANALGREKVVRHLAGGESEQLFEAKPVVRVLVCDATAEEGLNLQRVGAAIVHYDLPLAPTRIEQRIGRVDRIEARGRLRNVVLSSNCLYEGQWLSCLDKVIRVFHRSVAPLQYVLLEATTQIRDRLLDEGCEAIEAGERHLQDPNNGLDAELRRIRAQEALDSFDSDFASDQDFFETLEQADVQAEEGGDKAFDSWVVERLNFVRREAKPDGFRYFHDYRHPTLVPLHEVVTNFRRCIDRDPDSRLTKTQLAFRPMTFNRVISEKHAIGLLRVGNPFVDAMEALLRADDRGAAFALWRQTSSYPRSTEFFFQFQFFIEADMSAAQALLKSHRGSPEALRRRADAAFPPDYRALWLDSDLACVNDPAVLSVLARPFSKEKRQDGSRDFNIRREGWSSIVTSIPLPDWGELCERARRSAQQNLVDDDEFRERVQRCATRLRKTLSIANEALQSRIARLSGAVRSSETESAEFERKLGEALVAGIEAPTIRVDSIGSIFLSSLAIPSDEESDQ